MPATGMWWGRNLALAVVAAALAVVSGGAGCASAPGTGGDSSLAKPLSAADYYPLQPGWKWAYDLEKEGQHILAVYTVLERTPDTAIIQAGDERMVYAVTAQGIAQREGVALGDFVLKNPMALGTAWQVTGGSAKVAAVGQTVTVPSGAYADCVVVETRRSDPPRLSRTTYAPGVGPVAIEVEVQHQGRFVTTLRAALRGFTRPGEDPFGGAAR